MRSKVVRKVMGRQEEGENSMLVDHLARDGRHRFFKRPALAECALEMRRDDVLETLLETGMQFEDGFAGAIDEAAGFTMRQLVVSTDHMQGQTGNHPDPAKAAALDEARADVRGDIDFRFWHR